MISGNEQTFDKRTISQIRVDCNRKSNICSKKVTVQPFGFPVTGKFKCGHFRRPVLKWQYIAGAPDTLRGTQESAADAKMDDGGQGFRIMMEIYERFPDRESFDRYWNENYVPVVYEDVKAAFEDFVTAAAGHIYLSDYEEKGCISRADFKENLSQEAQFSFQDGLTEAFYEKNPEVYETAFALYEEAQMSGKARADVAQTFHETFQRLYAEFLDRLYDEKLA